MSVWEYLLLQSPKHSRIVVYLEAELLFRLQIEYWKNILPFVSREDMFHLHRLYIEDCRFKNSLPRPRDFVLSENKLTQITSYDKITFNEIYENISLIETLKQVPKENLSFEYQLADFFYDSSSELKPVLLEKIRHFTWTNWIAEIEILKSDILNGIMDINRLIPAESAIDTSDPTLLFNQLIGNEYLRWIVDENIFPGDYNYLEMNYSKEIFKFIYERFYNMWQVNGEDMSELIDLIYSYQYEKLLYRDVARSFGSVYSAGRQRNKVNQILVSYLYKLKREGQLSAIKPFTLGQGHCNEN